MISNSIIIIWLLFNKVYAFDQNEDARFHSHTHIHQHGHSFQNPPPQSSVNINLNQHQSQFEPSHSQFSNHADFVSNQPNQNQNQFQSNLRYNVENVKTPYLIQFPHNREFDVFKPAGQRDEYKRSQLAKRSIPLARWFMDPDVRFDVPRTLENVGTAARNSLESERTPVHHLKQLLGSSKNTLLSAMRIPPQNLIIPSDYEIVKKATKPRRVENDFGRYQDEYGNTFKSLGEMMRHSVRSGHDTLNHIGSVADEAKNILYSTRNSLPRIINYSRAPILKAPRRLSEPSHIILAPRILDVADSRLGLSPSNFELDSPETGPNLIRIGQLMDAVGVPKKDSAQLGVDVIPVPKRKDSTRLVPRFKDFNMVGSAVSALQKAKASVGANNLKEFLLKMRNELVKSEAQSEIKNTKKSKKNLKEEQMEKFVENLFDSKLDNNHNNNNDEHDSVLGHINPVMFERLYNESLKIKNSSQSNVNAKELFGPTLQESVKVGGENNKNLDTLTKDLFKPLFLEQSHSEDVQNFLNDFQAEIEDADFDQDT